MSWSDLLKNRIVQKHTTSRREIESLRDLVNRDLKDAGLDGLSNDRCFATAYNAVLQLSKMAIACSGHRVASGVGHHQKTVDAVKTALGAGSAEPLADYFETCRRKRNSIDYDASEIVSQTEASELLEKPREFQHLVEEWIAKHYSVYKL